MDSGIIPNIVCYAGGTCGDLLCALIDPTDAVVDENKIILTKERSKLKKPHLFTNDNDKDAYIFNIAQKYQSIPSHNFDYHIARQHSIIGIVVTDLNIAKIAAARFKNLHRPEVWNNMQKSCGAQTVEEYAQILIDFSNLVALHCNNLVYLNSIIDGTVISELSRYGVDVSDSGKEIYDQWLTLDLFK